MSSRFQHRRCRSGCERGTADLRAWLASGPARADGPSRRARPLFEPTDLEMEEPGVIQVDTQVGPMRGPSRWKTVVPDVEVDIGLLRNFELDLDFAYAIEGLTREGFPGTIQRLTTFGCEQAGAVDARDASGSRSWAVGMQNRSEGSGGIGSAWCGLRRVAAGVSHSGIYPACAQPRRADSIQAMQLPRGASRKMEAGLDLASIWGPDQDSS